MFYMLLFLSCVSCAVPDVHEVMFFDTAEGYAKPMTLKLAKKVRNENENA